MIDLGHVRAFLVVAEELHFGRAAERLNLTQSPLSRQIQLLEGELGTALFERTTRAVRLTPAGRTFLREAQRLLHAAERAEHRVRQVSRGQAGLVRLGFTAASAYEVLPGLVSRMRLASPDIDLVLHEAVTAEQVDALAAGRLDLGLIRPYPAGGEARIATAPLRRERLLLATPREHPLASGRRPALSDLDDQPFVTWSVGGGSYFLGVLGGLFRDAGIAPRVVQRVNQTHAMLALVGAGLGLALLPETARHIRIDGVALRPIALPRDARVELLLAWRADDDDPAVAALRDVALAFATDGSARSVRSPRRDDAA